MAEIIEFPPGQSKPKTDGKALISAMFLRYYRGAMAGQYRSAYVFAIEEQNGAYDEAAEYAPGDHRLMLDVVEAVRREAYIPPRR
jgi:hypothetical protein